MAQGVVAGGRGKTRSGGRGKGWNMKWWQGEGMEYEVVASGRGGVGYVVVENSGNVKQVKTRIGYKGR